MLQLVGEHPQSQCLRCDKGSIAGRSVDQDSRQVHDLGDPAAVLFPVQFESQVHVLKANTFAPSALVRQSYASTRDFQS